MIFLSFWGAEIQAQTETWTNQDIGSVAVAGSSAYNSGNDQFTVKGAGADIWGTGDAFQFVHVSWSGKNSVVAKVTSVQNTSSWAKAGIMIRETTAVGARNVALLVTPGNGVTFQRRLTANGNSVQTSVAGITVPVWLRLEMRGTTALASYSSDGSNWTLLGSDTISMPGTARVGLAMSSHTNNLGQATFVSVSAGMNATMLPSPWLDTTIGAPANVGESSYSSGVFTAFGSGNDIVSTSDQFYYLYQPFTGDGRILAHVASQQNTNEWAKTGLMLRESMAPGSKLAMLAVTPNHGSIFQYRTSTDGDAPRTGSIGAAAPSWLKLERQGDLVSAYQSADGALWNQVGVRVVPMTQQIYAGLPVTSHSSGYSKVVFDSVDVSAQPSHALPPPWQQADVGAIGAGGAGIYENGIYTLYGAGADIQGTADAFHFASIDDPSDGIIIARVAAQQDTDAWAKTGVMLRESTAANAREVSLLVTPHNGAQFHYRSTIGGGTTTKNVPGLVAPVWLKLEHYGDYVGAFYSSDGLTWTYAGDTSVSFGAGKRIGLAVTSHNANLARADFDNVSLTTGTWGLIGHYYADMTFQNLALTRVDPGVNFDWGIDTAPTPALPSNGFSIRWVGQVQPRYSETYTFITSADDGVRLWVDGQLVIDDWTIHGTQDHSGTITLQANRKYNLKLEYFESTTPVPHANVKLRWLSASQPLEIIPTSRLLAVDNDTDHDGLPDDWEQQIVDFSATDGITTVAQVLPGGDFDGDGLTNLQEYQQGLDPTNPDSDFDGVSDKQEELVDGTDPHNPDSVTPKRIAYFPFDTASFVSQEGQIPTAVTGISSATSVPGFSGNAMHVDQMGQLLRYEWARSNGAPNYSIQRGTVRMWFKLDWTPAAGAMSGAWSRLFDLGLFGASQVALHFNYDNPIFQFFVADQASGHSFTTWSDFSGVAAGQWHQVAVTYSPNSQKIYLDGALLSSSQTWLDGVLTSPTTTWNHPPKIADFAALGLKFGSDGDQPLKGAIDEAEFFNYELTPTQIGDDFAAADTDYDGLSDSWEMATFGNLDHGPSTDADGDGMSDIDEIHAGTPWNDFWNGAAPVFVKVAGDNQTNAPSGFLSVGLTVEVRNAQGTPFVGGSVDYAVTSGGGQLQLNSSDTPASTISRSTGADGQAKVYFRLPTAANSTSTISASITISGHPTQTVTFSATSGSLDAVQTSSPFNPINMQGEINADGSQDLTWENNPDSNQPVKIWLMEDDGTWTYYATAPLGATSFHIPPQ